MFRLSRLSLVLTVLAVSSSAAYSASVFNFDSDTVGKGTPFTDTNNGISATFSSSADPNGFSVIQPASYGYVFQTLSGNVLTDALASSNSSLTILFSTTLSSVNFDFGVIATAPTSLTIQVLRNGVSLGSVTETDSVPSGFVFPEGVGAFSASIFNELIVSSSTAFAIDNISVTAGTVPEPGTGSLLLAAAILLIGLRWGVQRARLRPDWCWVSEMEMKRNPSYRYGNTGSREVEDNA